MFWEVLLTHINRIFHAGKHKNKSKNLHLKNKNENKNKNWNKNWNPFILEWFTLIIIWNKNIWTKIKTDLCTQLIIILLSAHIKKSINQFGNKKQINNSDFEMFKIVNLPIIIDEE